MSLLNPDEGSIKVMEALLDDGRPLSAWRLAEAYAPLKSWHGRQGRNLAVKIAAAVGESRLASTLAGLNYRNHPEDDEVFFTCIAYGAHRWRPLGNLERIDARFKSVGSAPDPRRSDFLSLRAMSLGLLRDFPMAHGAIDEAISLGPSSYWLLATRSLILELEDRYKEALCCARDALQLGPRKQRAILQLVDCLIHCGLDDEAIALLERAHIEGESGRFAERLVNLFSEREEPEKAIFYLKAVEERFPLCDKESTQWKKRRYADLLYMLGDYEGCLVYCDQLPNSYHTRIAEKMRLPGALERERKRLKVPFIRQHNMTCGPATLAALAAYWKRDFDHLLIAEAICYEGTHWHKGRAWAEQNGFHTIEFKLTHEILVALIDRGIPFTLTTEEIANSHMQACIGYDNRQGTVIVRDPTLRHFVEIRLEGLLETHPILGPRCMVMIPRAEGYRLDGLTFPDAEVYDANGRLFQAFDAHDRPAIRAAIDAMPDGHPLTLWSRARLASYDRNPASELFFTNELLRRFPKHEPLRYSLLGVLKKGGYHGRLKESIADALKESSCDPLYYSEMGELLQRDARNLSMADYYLRKAVRLRWATGQVYSNLSWCRRSERRFEEAALYLRFASCLEAGNEWYAASYAQLCRVIGRPEEGLLYLRQRITRLGSKSGSPWQTLASELQAQDKAQDAIMTLEEGVASRPEDGELMLATGRLLALWGDRERGDQLMNSARGRVHDAEWHREMAEIHAFFGRREEAIRHRREHLRLFPYSIDSYRAIATLFAQEGGKEEAIEYLTTATREFPDFSDLWCLRAEWEAMLGPAMAIPSLKRGATLDPDSLWILRELAIRHSEAGETELGLKEIAEAIRKYPNVAASHRIHGLVLEKAGHLREAEEAYREAIKLDIDETFASEGLLRLSTDVSSRLIVLRFIETEMRRQVSNGAIVPVYRDLAYQYLDPRELLVQLRCFCAERPDLYETWLSRLTQTLAMGLLEEGFECARMLIERFPLLPKAWADAAKAHHAAGDFATELRMLEAAVTLSPAWDWAARQLSIVLERVGRHEEAVQVLNRAIDHEPLVGENYGFLSDLLRRIGRKGEAFEVLKAGMKSCPAYDWGWESLGEWARELKREEEAIAVLDAHHASQGHSASWWGLVGIFYMGLGRPEEALSSTEKGLCRHPKDGDLFNTKARILGRLERFSEALEACEAGLNHDPNRRSLVAQRATVLMASGEPNEAIREMTLLVEKHPDYLAGFEILAAWLDARERWEELRSLCIKWARQAPQAALAFGFLGDAEERLLNATAAKEAYGKAFFLAPTYAYAGRKFLWFQIDASEFDEAERTLKLLEHYSPSDYVAGDAVKLALRQGNRKEASRLAEVLLGREDLSVGVLSWMQTLFSETRWVSDWVKLLDHRVRRSRDPSPVLLVGWIYTLVAREKVRMGARILRRILRERVETQAQGWAALLEVSAQGYPRLVRGWIRGNRDWFRSRYDLWAAALNAMVAMRDYKAAAKWGGDWIKWDSDISGSTLFNYGLAVGDAKGWRTALPIREAILTRFPAANFTASLRVLVALHFLIEGKIEKAREVAQKIEVGAIAEFYQGYYDLYQCLMAAHEEHLEPAAAHYRAALKKFDGSTDREVDQVFKDVVERLSELVPWANRQPKSLYRIWGRHRNPARTLTWQQCFFFFWILIIFTKVLVDVMSR